MTKAQIPTDEDFRELEMENGTATVMDAIRIFIHKHHRTPTYFEQIRALAGVLAPKPNKIDPLLRFSWKVSKPFVDQDEPKAKKINIEVTVTSPDHPTVVKALDFDLTELPPEPEHVKY